MMVANSANLIVTVKPINQRNNIAAPAGIGSTRSSVKSTASYLSARSQLSTRDISEEMTHVVDSEEYEEDVVKSHLSLSAVRKPLPIALENMTATV